MKTNFLENLLLDLNSYGFSKKDEIFNDNMQNWNFY